MKKSYERPHSKLERRRGVFFRIGMMISLLITFVAFEWKTAIPRLEIPVDISGDTVDTEIAPITWRREETTLPDKKTINKQLTPIEKSDEFLIVSDSSDETQIPIDTSTYSAIIPIKTEPEILPAGFDFELMPEVFPEFPGKEDGLMRFLLNNTKYPEIARESKISGTVYLNFIVDENGDVVSIECLHSPSPFLTEEAIRVLKKMPKWKPGYQGGKKVRVRMSLPFTFTLKK